MSEKTFLFKTLTHVPGEHVISHVVVVHADDETKALEKAVKMGINKNDYKILEEHPEQVDDAVKIKFWDALIQADHTIISVKSTGKYEKEKPPSEKVEKSTSVE